MSPETVMDLAHRMLLVTTLIAAPLLLIALIAGLVIGMLQAATQINESTLSFIPKLLLLVLALFATGPWMLRVLVETLGNSICGFLMALTAPLPLLHAGALPWIRIELGYPSVEARHGLWQRALAALSSPPE